uniref:E3 ubiquitin-protein ligase RNF103-like n=1 Tax=Phallusia mammillata TaxID=59560 RepID=A0A6F9DR78_9ASCI|nr:E3 ubiquitin-protein ligase RNF103-like [Phallusia mammillata]
MFFLKLFLFLSYFIALLLVFFVLDFFAWNGPHIVTSLIDPLSLSVKQLRWLLHSRGISYNQAVEKNDLTDLILASGSVTKEKVTFAQFVDENQPESTRFYTSSELDESLNKAGDVWLVQVITEDNNGNISPLEWKKLIKRTAMIGVNAGQIFCKDSPDLCESRSFLTSQLILGYHYGGYHKLHLHTLTLPTNCGSAFKWINTIFNQKLEVSSSLSDFKHSLVNKKPDKNHIQVLYISAAKLTPAVFGSLQLHFGKISVGKLDFSADSVDVNSLLSPDTFVSNSIVHFKTHKTEFLYGNKTAEHMTFSHLSMYLMMLNPDINLFFTFSVYMCNVLGALSIFTCQGYVVSRGFAVLKSLLAYNIVLLGAWLLFSSVHFQPLNELIENFTGILQKANSTDVAAFIRSGVIRAMQMPYLFLTGFIVFFNFAFIALQRLGLISYEHEYELTELLLDNDAQGTNDISHRWIQRLATPELWLQPLIPNDYIDELPVWEYSPIANSSDAPENDRCLSDRTSSVSPVRSNEPNQERGRPCFPSSPRQTPTLSHGILRSIRTCLRGRSPRLKRTKGPPKNMRRDTSCAICLDHFRCRVLVCGLPCSHVFHNSCIQEWLYNDKHCCPVCRWPAFKAK